MDIIKQILNKLGFYKKIYVEILPELYANKIIYRENTNCYLARSLKKLGYKNIYVLGYGNVMIEGKSYKPLEEFSYDILRRNFYLNIKTKLTLVKQ